MGAVAGYKQVFSVGATATVSMTAQPMSLVSTGIYRITLSTRRVLDPTVTPVVKDGGVTVSAALWSVDYLTSLVTFSGYTVLGAITMDASYVAMSDISEGQSLEVSLTNQLLDITPYNSTGVKTCLQGLRDASFVFSGTLLPWTDLASETVAGITAYATESTPRAWRCQIYDGTNYFVAVIWGKVKDYKQSTAVDGVTTLNVTVEAAARTGKSIAFDVW